MNSFSRFSAILFAIMLAFVSISKDHYEPLLITPVQNTEGEHSSSYFSEKKLNDVLSSHRQSELVVSQVNNLPAPGSKFHPLGFLEASFSIELRIRTIVSHCLAQSKKIYPNLTIGVIIFPFHHFW